MPRRSPVRRERTGDVDRGEPDPAPAPRTTTHSPGRTLVRLVRAKSIVV